MRRSPADIVITAAVAAAAFAAAAAGAPAPLLGVLGIALFAAPGYVLAGVLLGGRVAGLERVAVAAGLTLAVPVLGGLALYAAGVPLHRTAWAGLLAGVTLAGDAALFARRRGWRGGAVPRGGAVHRLRALPVRHAAAFGAALVIAAGGVGLARAGAAAQHYPGFTQLWLSPGRAGAASADLGVSNHEGTATRYQLVLVQGRRTTASWDITLANGARWDRTITLSGSGTTADLYRIPDLTHPYRQVTASRTGS